MTDKAHILIVDDEPGIREIIEDYLMQHRFSVATAENGAEIRRRMAERTPNLVILDLNMPGEDGLTLTRQLRASGNVGIILLTATAESVDRVVGLEIGADDYIAKPFNLRELVARIHTVLRRLGEGASSPKSRGTLRDASVVFSVCWR
jgi:two-component system phosphate regulon response regulator OmpR